MNTLFTRIPDRDEFADWCYYNGIIWVPSHGSKLGAKLGITDAMVNKARRFDIGFQLGRFSDWLLAFQIPALAIIAIYVSKLQLFWLSKTQPNPFEADLDLDL